MSSKRTWVDCRRTLVGVKAAERPPRRQLLDCTFLNRRVYKPATLVTEIYPAPPLCGRRADFSGVCGNK